VSKNGKPIRVGIFTLSFPTPSETFIVTKVLGLLKAGFDVQIFTLTPSLYWDRFARLASWPDIQQRIHCAPPTRPLGKLLTRGLPLVIKKALQHPLAFTRFLVHNWKTRQENHIGFWKGLFRRLQFIGRPLDVLHIEFDTQGLGTADLKSFLNCRLLLSARGTFQRTSVPDSFPKVYDHLFRYVDGYHFISKYLRTNTYRLGLSPAVQTWLIKPAIDLEFFVPTPQKSVRALDAPFRILSVGRLGWEKGYEFALDAVAHLRDAGIPLEYIIVGDGPYEEALVFAARQRNLLQSGWVKFRGAVSQLELLNYYRAADVMLHPALDEGFCNAVIEAQAMELPVVTSDAGGLPENVENEVTGFVVPRRDPEAMAEKLIQLALNPQLCRKLGRAGREHVIRTFALSDQVGEFVSLYESLAAKSK
jgi:colanic acid/amylovoran biosynthesis glycosyltransferase